MALCSVRPFMGKLLFFLPLPPRGKRRASNEVVRRNLAHAGNHEQVPEIPVVSKNNKEKHTVC
jgi:hypothetical protein